MGKPGERVRRGLVQHVLYAPGLYLTERGGRLLHFRLDGGKAYDLMPNQGLAPERLMFDRKRAGGLQPVPEVPNQRI